MSANDRLYGELLKPIGERYYDLAVEVAKLGSGPGAAEWAGRVGSMDTLEEVGDRTAKVLEVAAPLWEDMRAMAGLAW